MKHEKGHEPGHVGHEHTEIAGIRFEEADINYRPITIAATYGVVVFTVFLGVAWGTFHYLAAREARLSTGPNPLAEKYARKQPPEPRLQADPRGDLLQLRAAEDAALGKLAWVDRRNGVVQLPIDRAMEMLVSRGLPVRADAPAGPSPARPRPMSSAPGSASSLQPSTHAPAQTGGDSPSQPPAQPGAPGHSGTSSQRPSAAGEAIAPEH